MLKLALGCFCLMASSVVAGPAQDWGMSGDWAIKVDSSADNGCFMERGFPSGTIVRVGFVPNREGAFFAAFNQKWFGIKVDETKTVIFDFDVSRFGGEVLGISENGIPGGYAFFNNPEFTSEIGRRLSVTIIGESGDSEEIDLAGSQRAIIALRECQGEQS